MSKKLIPLSGLFGDVLMNNTDQIGNYCFELNDFFFYVDLKKNVETVEVFFLDVFTGIVKKTPESLLNFINAIKTE